MACGTNIVPGFQEANRKVNVPMDEKAFNKYMDEEIPDPAANTPEDIIEAQRIVKHLQETGKYPEDAIKWQNKKKTGSEERKKKASQPDSLIFAANQVREGKMSVQKFRELVQKNKKTAVTPMQKVPELVSVTNLARGLNNKGKAGKGKIIGLPGIEIQEGTNVGLRLDIPAYQDMDTWVNAIHFEEKVEGGNAYSTASAGTNAVFGKKVRREWTSDKAVKVATGTAKSPFAVIDVAWQNQTPEQTHKEITAALEDSKKANSRWKQIGMNPNRSGFFYDKATFLPVANASRVLQVGALVMAQDVQYVGREGDTMFAPKMGEFFGNKAEKEFDNQLDNELNLDTSIMKFESNGYDSPLNPHVEVVLNSDGNAVPMHNKHPLKGKYAFMLEKGANKRALDVFKSYGRAKLVEWSPSERAHFNPVSGLISLRMMADRLPSNNAVIYNDLLGTAMHETWHMVDYAMGEQVYPDKFEQGQFDSPDAFSGIDKGFRTAFFKDGQNLGITLDDGSYKDGAVRNRYQQDVYRIKGHIDELKIYDEHDDNLSALVFYDQMLNDPLMHNKINRLVKSNPPEAQRNLLANIFRGNESIGMKQMVLGISDENVLHNFGHSFMGMDGSITDEKYIYPPRSLLNYIQQGFNDGGIPPLSDIPSIIEELQDDLKDSSEMAEMLAKRRQLYQEVHEEGKSLGQQLELLSPAMDIIDAMTSGHAHVNGKLNGHGIGYYTTSKYGLTDGGLYRRLAEAFAELGQSWGTKDERAWQYIEKYFPNSAKEFESIMKKHKRIKDLSEIPSELGRQLKDMGGRFIRGKS